MANEADLTQEQFEKFVHWLEQKVPHGLMCSVCGQNNWEASPRLSTTMNLSGSAIAIGGPIQPLISLTCKNCAHTVFFNALISGVMDVEKKEADNASGK